MTASASRAPDRPSLIGGAVSTIHTTLGTRVAALALAAGALAACSADRSGVTGPDAQAPLAAVTDAPPRVVALTRRDPIGGGVQASATITPERGGTLVLREAGLTVSVPAGAVSVRTIIWARAHAGKMVAYDFGPHGTQFLVPIRVRQELKKTNWDRVADRSQAEAGYFMDDTQLDAATGTATVQEFLPVELSPAGSRLEFDVRHFSGYLLSTGRVR